MIRNSVCVQYRIAVPAIDVYRTMNAVLNVNQFVKRTARMVFACPRMSVNAIQVTNDAIINVGLISECSFIYPRLPRLSNN